MPGWIKWEKDIESDPRFLRMLRALRNADVTQASRSCVTGAFPLQTLAVGALLRFWSYVDTHIREDNTVDLGPDDIDDLVGISGFAKSLPEDWLRVIDDHTVELPAYQEHNGVEAKKRDLNQKRQELHRSRTRNGDVTQQCDSSVTGALPDQTRPDHIKNGHAQSGLALNSTAAPNSDPLAKLLSAIRQQYPKRAGSQSWRAAEKALAARLREGHKPEEVLAGVTRYAEFCRATDKFGTEYVKQASTFLGPDKHFTNDWAPPAHSGRGNSTRAENDNGLPTLLG